MINKIYVMCLPKIKTGGTELLHQLVKELNENGADAAMVYTDKSENPMPSAFAEYVEKYFFLEDLEFSSKDIIILPENMVWRSKLYPNVKKIIWWLSVDNFTSRNGYKARVKNEGIVKATYHLLKKQIVPYSDVSKLDGSVEEHWVQSYYAENFLKSHGIKSIRYVSDYINDSYFRTEISFEDRENVVLYNPAKGWEFTSKLIKATPNIKWIPLKNMTTEQVGEQLRRSKVYVDFGNHPGKDRFPREAAISGCCVITGKNGSAQYYEDIPISETYKFEACDKNINKIINTINDCLVNYIDRIDDFKGYRENIKKEKEVFRACVSDALNYIKLI